MVDTNSYYGDYITNFDEICRKSIVRITSCDPRDPSKLLLRTGVVITETERSCIIITSGAPSGRIRVEFYDGTTKTIPSQSQFVGTSMDFKLTVIPIFGHGNDHWKTANFSDSEVRPSQKVFTCGFNSDSTRNFISGGLVSGINLANEYSHKKGTVFVHSCSVGTWGYEGSAVFNERRELVGINFFYTTCQGVDYVSSKPSLCGASSSASISTGDLKSESEEYGGLVSAWNMGLIKCGLADIYPNIGRMSLQQILQYFKNTLEARDKVSGP